MMKKYLNNVCEAFNIAFENAERFKDKVNSSIDPEETVEACLEYEFWEERLNKQKAEVLAVINEIQDKDICIELTEMKELQAILIILQEEKIKKQIENK